MLLARTPTKARLIKLCCWRGPQQRHNFPNFKYRVHLVLQIFPSKKYCPFTADLSTIEFPLVKAVPSAKKAWQAF